MAHLVESMFAARVIPWHYDETQDRTILVAEPVSLPEAIRLARIEWEVEVRPVYSMHDGAYVLDDRHYAVVRVTDGKVLGVVGGIYSPIQNRELAEFMDALLATGEVKVPTAGSLDGGRRIWIAVELDNTITVNGETAAPYFVGTTSHDGNSGMTGMFTGVLPVCSNTLHFAKLKAQSKVTIRHTTNALHRVAQARESLGMAWRYFDAFTDEVETLIDQAVSEAEFDQIVSGLFPIPEEGDASERTRENTRRRQTTVRSLWETGTHAAYRRTGWGAYNAVNEWEVWSTRAQRPGDTRLGSFLGKQQKRLLSSNPLPVTVEAHRRLVALR